MIRIAASVVGLLALVLFFWGTIALIKFAHGGERVPPLFEGIKLMGGSVLCFLIAIRGWMLRRR